MTPFFPLAHYPTAFVLDVSVASAWLLTTCASIYTDAVMLRMFRQGAAIPAGFPADAADVVLSAGEPLAAVTHYLSVLRNQSIHLDDGREPHVWTATVPLAHRLGLPVNRAAYLELAIRLNLPLATTDPALIAAAPTAGVTRLVP